MSRMEQKFSIVHEIASPSRCLYFISCFLCSVCNQNLCSKVPFRLRLGPFFPRFFRFARPEMFRLCCAQVTLRWKRAITPTVMTIHELGIQVCDPLHHVCMWQQVRDWNRFNFACRTATADGNAGTRWWGAAKCASLTQARPLCTAGCNC